MPTMTRIRPTSALAVSVALGLLLAFLVAPVRAAELREEHRIYLSAGAPWGAPGAASTFAPACGDTTTRDTLWLCFEPARDESLFYGFAAEMYVYAQPGDTLGSFWDMGRGGANNGGLIVQFGPDETFPQPQPWAVQGVGTVLYDRTPASGRARFLYAMPTGSATAVRAGRRYVLGRVVLGQKHAGLDGCERPVCLEWHAAKFAFRASGDEPARLGDSRWVGRGSSAADCRARIPAWRPRQ